jgi:hypothetical protein
MRPSGGAGQRAPQTSQTACRFQNEFGLNFGNTRRALGLVVDIDCSLLFAGAKAATAVTLRREIAGLIRSLFLLRIAGRQLEQMRRERKRAPRISSIRMTACRMQRSVAYQPAYDSEIPAEMGHVEPKRQSDVNCIA